MTQPPPLAVYDRDFHAWATEQAALLRAGRLAEADVAHIAEEIEDLGRSQRSELVSHLEVLLLHLLKWEFQPERRGRSWQLTIDEQRDQIERHISKNPSLLSYKDEALVDAYKFAVRRAAHETATRQDYFPWGTKYSFEQVVDPTFWPDLD